MGAGCPRNRRLKPLLFCSPCCFFNHSSCYSLNSPPQLSNLTSLSFVSFLFLSSPCVCFPLITYALLLSFSFSFNFKFFKFCFPFFANISLHLILSCLLFLPVLCSVSFHFLFSCSFHNSPLLLSFFHLNFLQFFPSYPFPHIFIQFSSFLLLISPTSSLLFISKEMFRFHKIKCV